MNRVGDFTFYKTIASKLQEASACPRDIFLALLKKKAAQQLALDVTKEVTGVEVRVVQKGQ